MHIDTRLNLLLDFSLPTSRQQHVRVRACTSASVDMFVSLLLQTVADASGHVPFFYISLNSSSSGAARSRKLQQAFGKWPAHVEMLTLVPAVDGNASGRSYAHADAQYNHVLKRNTPSEVGCSMSHVLAIQRAEAYCARTGCEMAVIMEDDVTPSLLPYWTQTLPRLASTLPDSWAVVQLQLIAQEREWTELMQAWRSASYPSHTESRQWQQAGDESVSPYTAPLAVLHDRRRHFGTGAYLISRRGMRQILAPFTQPATPPGAALLANTIGGKPPTRTTIAAGSLVIPLELDELQADVHLIYSLASPAYLATPPLLSCAHSTSTIEHCASSLVHCSIPHATCSYASRQRYLVPEAGPFGAARTEPNQSALGGSARTHNMHMYMYMYMYMSPA